MKPNGKPTSKSGFVAIVGLPNAGKSTLVNQLTQTKLCIVSKKPQTTRNTVSIILTRPGAQIIFQDTPGFHEAKTIINEVFLECIRKTIKLTDLILYVVDPNIKKSQLLEELDVLVRESGKPVVKAVNKIDVIDTQMLDNIVKQSSCDSRLDFTIGVSALTGQNCEQLIDKLIELLPEGPFLYSEDDLSDMPERFFASEIVREQILNLLGQEVPHKTAVSIETFRDDGTKVLIQGDIHVERNSQKKILIGKNGQMIKKIGTLARQNIEAFLDRSVRLQLFVKVSPNWTKNINKLKEFGYIETR
ncbi:MAG: GTPase Era [Pseudomonadota bacterium]